jgi:hypothetical protein
MSDVLGVAEGGEEAVTAMATVYLSRAEYFSLFLNLTMIHPLQHDSGRTLKLEDYSVTIS